ncbi:hypothetical protein EDC18_10752 [Natranaerovirga pectinivora]|uniref:Membrane protein YdfK n=1 Tax=Natranaerovirga pectinivora TaxID=682400 RepID=A0A4R3MIZ6_9FIRM|nr:DUF554 domain-containing protein [Natranaerovirga pectinivora]TCT13983.1 hypothetical protein EDC18_10752 [Natranaerovirga pectinivora]
MIGIGTIVNFIAIILGGFLGLGLKTGLSSRFKQIVMQSLGLAVLFIGVSGTIQSMFKITESNGIDRQYIMTMILSLVIGGILGEWINIELKLDNLGLFLQKKIGTVGDFAKGFVTASLVYCIGAMAIVGALEDGLLRNPNTLFAKSILDGISAVIFSSTLGIGVVFSSVSVLIYQGGITLLAGTLEPILTDVVIQQMSLIGNILIFAIGINILEIKKIKVGNLLPAIFIPMIVALFELLF